MSTEIQLRDKELALLAYMAHIGVSAMSTQLHLGNIRDEKIEPTKAMIKDAGEILERLKKFAEEKAETPESAEIGQPGVTLN